MRQNAERMVEFLDMRRSNASENFLPHTHDYYELSYLTNGHTKIKLNGLLLTSRRMPAGWGLRERSPAAGWCSGSKPYAAA